MATLVETALLLLIIFVVYTHRPPQARDRSTTDRPQVAHDVDPQSRPSAGRAPTPLARPVRVPSNSTTHEATVFRATTPAGLPSAVAVPYRVAAKAEPETDIPLTIRRVLGEEKVTQDRQRSASEVSGLRAVPSLPTIPREAHNGETPLPASRPLRKAVAAGPGLMTPPPSTQRATAIPRAVKAEPRPESTSALYPRQALRVSDGDEDEVSVLELPSPARSASSTSTKVAPAPTKKRTTRAAVQVTVSDTGALILKRHHRGFRNLAGVLSEDKVEQVGTYWFKTQSDTEILAPPEFVSDSPSGIRLGDVFCHSSPSSHQLWVRTTDAVTARPYWNCVPLGYQRGDGRKLSLTKGLTDPTWLK